MTRAGYKEVAAALKASPPELSEIRMKAMERQLLESVRSGHRPSRARFSRWASGGGVAIAAAAAWLFLARGPAPEPSIASTGDSLSATYSVFSADVAGSESPLVAGREFVTSEDERVEIEQGMSSLWLGPSADAVFHLIDEQAIEAELRMGRLSVAFHPAIRDEQSLMIQTPTARVEVVGTVFEVSVSAEGDTSVEVSEGVVAVTSRASEERTLVSAGEAFRVDAVSVEERASEGEAEAEVDENRREVAEENTSADAGARRMTANQRFLRADRFFDDGNYDAVRTLLLPLTGVRVNGASSARALTVIAESHARQGNFGNAAEAYRRATAVASGGAHGANAAFALGRLLDRNLGDDEGAMAAYRRYLLDAPEGALARQAEEALCRLGDDEACGSE